MEGRHASLGRRTLEEIRQKRAAERLGKVSSGSDLAKPPSSDGAGIRKSESTNRLTENDIGGLLSQLKDLQQRNAELEETNKNLYSTLQERGTENKTLQERLSDLEQNTIPSLRKALRDVAMEKDAAVVAREDLSAQLRTLKKRTKEAEEEQYRAEEDAASLRAELNSLLQQKMLHPHDETSATGYPVEQIQLMEKELSDLRYKLENESRLRQQERESLSEEQARTSALISQNREFEEKLASVTKEASDAVTQHANQKTFSLEDKEKLQKQLHEMVSAIERLESSRQKLLMEIDSQSSEIERLFEENSSLSSAYQESLGLVAYWENQVKNCLQQNEDLRGMLEKLRKENASLTSLNETASQAPLLSGLDDSRRSKSQSGAELYSVKAQLADEQNRADSLSAEVLKLSVRLQQVTQAYNNLSRLYKPVLRNIETSLFKMKQDHTSLVAL